MPWLSLGKEEEEEEEKEDGHQPPVDQQRWIVELPEAIRFKDNEIIEEFDEELGVPTIRFKRRPLSLLSVLSHFRDLEATDPRDKVFAFLNLAEDGLGLVPDYRAEARDIFIQAAKSMIEKRQGSRLAVLSHVQDPSDTRIQGLPSWVPDFSARLGRIPFEQGGHDDRFLAGTDIDIDFEDMSLSVNSNNTISVRAIKVDDIAVSTQLGQDPVVQALKLAIRGPAEYPIEPRAWCANDRGRYLRRPQAVSRVEALWRTLVIDGLTEMDPNFGDLNSRANLGIGFSNWILADILEARDLFVEWVGLSADHWTRMLIDKSFCTRMTLWSAMYDGRQLSDELEVSDLEGMLEDGRAKREQEAKESSDTGEDGGHLPTQIRFLPTTQHIFKCFPAPTTDEAHPNKDPLGGKYKRPSMQRLTPLERRKLRNFEKHMRQATEGRRLFITASGLFGLGPKSLGQDLGTKDEVWILMNARVPFILRHVEGSKYRVVGEAYVHGIMYGEGYDHYTSWDEHGRIGVNEIHLV